MAPLQRPKSKSEPTTAPDQLQIHHFIHPHLLHKLYMSSEFNCDGCNTGGFGVRFRCSACDFDLHEQCATSAHRISSHIHPNHHLVLVNRTGDDCSYVCDLCKGVAKGLSYTCEVQTCEFDAHTVCVQVPVTTTVAQSLTSCHPPAGVSTAVIEVYRQQQMQGTPTTVISGYNGVSNSQPVMVNPQQGTSTTMINGYNGENNSQPVAVNHQSYHQQQQHMQGIHTMQLGGYSQHAAVNYQQKQGMATTGFGGYYGVNNNQTYMLNNQQPPQQGVAMAGFGGYHGVKNIQTTTLNHHHHHQQQQYGQEAPTTPCGGYQGLNSQLMTVNHHQQPQGVPTMPFNSNSNYQMMTNHQHHQQLSRQQQQGMSATAVGGYTVVNNNQTMMITQPPSQQTPQQPMPNNYSKVGKLAANILSASIIGIPIFNSRN